MGAARGLTAPYEQLAALAEAESVAAINGDLERLAALTARRDALVATLPATPPAAARPLLERALAAQRGAEHALASGLAETRAALVRLAQGGASAQAYATAGTATASTINAVS